MRYDFLKFFSLLLTLTILFSLASCSKKGPSGQENIPTDTTSATEANTDTPPKDDNGKDNDDEQGKNPEDKDFKDALSINFEREKALIKATSPAIPASVGDNVDLTLYSFLTAEGNVISPADIVWSSEEITINGNTVSPTSKGVYKMTATIEQLPHTVYLVVKDVDEDEYVLYFNDFEEENSLDGFEIVAAPNNEAVKIENGRLSLDASADTSHSVRVLLPEWLEIFGNYTITADATITQRANPSRWMSLMFRVQPAGAPYYHMCVRSDAKANNGVEIAHYTPSASWEYFSKAPHSSELSTTDLSTFKITVNETRADVYVDGTLRGSGYALSHYKTGGIGLQASGSKAVFENIKVTLAFDREEKILLEPTLIDRIESVDELDNLSKSSPDIAMLYLDSEINVTDRLGQKLVDVGAAIAAIGDDIIPAFVLPSYEECDFDAICGLFARLDVSEIMVVSKETDSLKVLRARNKRLIGVLDLTEYKWSIFRPIDARSEANSAGARICLLPSNMADQSTIEFFNVLNMTVWCETSDNSATEALRLITSGANAIISEDVQLVRKYLRSSLFTETSLLRPISIIGHRGMPSQAPENTIAGSALAAKHGANIIENDIYITSDGVLVVMHDGTLDRTTNGTGKVEDYSYAQLCEFMVDDAPDAKEKLLGRVEDPQPIPTLVDYIETFKGTDTFIFIEIKSSKSDILVPALKAVLDEYDFYDQCSVICFSADTLAKVKEIIPQMSVGLLCGTSDVDTIMSSTSGIASSFNPSKEFVSQNLVKYLADRGIFTWPWTVNDRGEFDSLFLMAVAGITTNYANYAEKYVKRLYADSSEYTFAANSTADVNMSIELYGATRKDDTFENSVIPTYSAEMFLIEGDTDLKFDGKQLTATRTGSATVVFRIGFTVGGSATAYVYTQPISVTVE